MAMALALHQRGMAAEIYDARSRGASHGDKRVLALSYGSQLTLQSLGVWEGLPATAIETIHVSHQGRLGRTVLRADEENVPALGQVLSAGDLARRLDQAVTEAGIVWHENTAISAAPEAPLVIWAEGAIDEKVAPLKDYHQHAVVCSAQADDAPRGWAWERFTPEGPVAALPHGKELAIVLTCAPSDGPALGAMADTEFLTVLQRRFGPRVRFTACGPRFVFPLGLRFRDNPVGDRQVWIGNAAQTLHPVAGQGFNLALRDIADLALVLTDAADPGDPHRLDAYRRRRSLDRRTTIGFTDGLVGLFSNDIPLLAHARGAGLLAMDLLPPLRSFLAGRMMFGARAW